MLESTLLLVLSRYISTNEGLPSTFSVVRRKSASQGVLVEETLTVVLETPSRLLVMMTGKSKVNATNKDPLLSLILGS